ncbi:GL21267 [Drosophila persimilis]|uniref:GL21267 n=1 Tax=Drosophila persimilis TaxID=7234 RepID=B4GX71_DROPE|nr:GL21267 [Drosophila persimilis]
MAEPKTGPVTQALLRLVENMPKRRESFVRKNGEEDDDFHYSDGEFVIDSMAHIEEESYHDHLDLEPLQIAEFESTDEYDIVAEPVDPCPLQDALPMFELNVDDF